MTGLDDEVWDDPVRNVPRILVSHRRAGQAFRKAPLQVRSVPFAEMWTSRLTAFVEDGAADAVVVALDMSNPQGQRPKKVVSVGINDVGTTPTRAQLKVLADVSPQCRNRHTEMQRSCLLHCVYSQS
jgi:hypothetical protein